MRQAFLLVVVAAITLVSARAQSPARPARWRSGSCTRIRRRIACSSAVHGGAGTMSFTALLNRGAVTPEFNFLHRGVIPAGSGIGHHFHNVVEEMFVILDGEAQFTIDGRTASVKGPAGVLCRTGHSHAIYNPGPAPVQWMNLNVSLVPGVYDNFDLGDTRVGAALDRDSHVHDDPAGQVAAGGAGARGRGAAAPAPDAVLSRRVAGPAMFSTTWSYIDHVLVPPGAATPELRMTASARRITCSAARERSASRARHLGNGGRFAPATRFRFASASRPGSPIRVPRPLELFVMGVARDMAAKTQLLTGRASADTTRRQRGDYWRAM